MTTAILPGSFDPPTLGHLDIIRRANLCFDRVIVAVGVNPEKTGMFTPQQRVQMLRSSLPEVEVIEFQGALVVAARKHGADCIVKGIRDGNDFPNEQRQATVNWELAGIPTLFLNASAEWAHVSSSMIKELVGLGIDPSPYVSQQVSEILAERGQHA